MRTEDQLILELCKTDRDEQVVRSLLVQSDLDWNRFLALINKHEVAPLVLSRLIEFPLPDRVDERLRSAAKKEIRETTISHATMRSELARVQHALRSAGIDCILLKGLSLDYSGLRTIKDLDILVREDQFIEAIRAVEQLDYDFVGMDRTSYLKPAESRMLLDAIHEPDLDEEAKTRVLETMRWNNHYEMVNRQRKILVEIHSNLFHRRRGYTENIERLLDRIDAFWTNRRYDPTLECYTLSNEYLLLLMSVHMTIKRSPANHTFVLKLACDLDNLVHQSPDWELLVDAAIRLRVAPFVLYALLQTRTLLKTPIPQPVLMSLRKNCSKAQLKAVRLHLDCLRSLDSYSVVSSKLYVLMKPYVFESRLSERVKWLFLLPIFFPPRWKMAGFFNMRKDSPLIYATYLLNPFRLIYQLAKSVVDVWGRK